MKLDLSARILLSLTLLTLAACGSGGSDGENADVYLESTPYEDLLVPTDFSLRHDANGNIVVDWWQKKGVTYELFWSTSKPVATRSGSTSIELTKPPFVHRNLNFGTRYYYKLRAISSYETGDFTATLDTLAGLPGSPESISVATDHAGNTLTWDPVSKADYYTVYWENGVDESGTIEFAISPLVHSGLVGAAYTYRVASINGFGEGEQSISVSVTPDLPPATPVNFGVYAAFYSTDWNCPPCTTSDCSICTGTLKTGAQVYWRDTGAAYRVYRCENVADNLCGQSPLGLGLTCQQIVKTESDTFLDKFAPPTTSQNLGYYLVAENDYGTSPPTETACYRP